MTNTVKRKAISAKTKIDVAIGQAEFGHIRCGICRTWLAPGTPRILEHMTPHAFTADDSLENLRWVHKLCADLKTNGPKHLKVDGDKSKIAKADRLANPKPKMGRKIPSRPFNNDKEYRAAAKEWRRAKQCRD